MLASSQLANAISSELAGTTEFTLLHRHILRLSASL